MFRIFHAEMGRLTGTRDENKQGDPIFLLQYFNVSYMAFKCVEFEKNCMSFSRELLVITTETPLLYLLKLRGPNKVLVYINGVFVLRELSKENARAFSVPREKANRP